MGNTSTGHQGKLYVIGLGPGDVRFLTAEAVAALGEVDWAVCDPVAEPRLLRPLLPPEAALDTLPPDLPPEGQEELFQRMIQAVKEGKRVARLLLWGPSDWHPPWSDWSRLRQAAVPFHVIPGISAETTWTTYLELAPTQAKRIFATPPVIASGWQELWEIVSNMPQGESGPVVLLRNPWVFPRPEDPSLNDRAVLSQAVWVVVRPGLAGQKVFRTVLASLPEELFRLQADGPVFLWFGPEGLPQSPWFSQQPLFGRRILLCRPEADALPTAKLLQGLGAEVFLEPMIVIGPPPDWTPVDQALDELASFDWIVFSSGNGVRYFLGRLWERGGDLRQLAGPRIAAIGPGTAAALATFHLRAELIPPEFRAESLLELLAPQAAGKRFLLVRASRGRDVLPEGLQAAGASVRQVVAYTSADLPEARPEIRRRIAAGAIDWIVVTSSSIARNLVRLFGADLRQAKLASISPVTSATLQELGFRPAVEARQFTLRGLIAAILQAEGTPPQLAHQLLPPQVDLSAD